MIPELSSGMWIGIAFGLFGILFWILGLLLFDRLIERYRSEPPGEHEPDP